jgi:sugar (pentulose or hexulose) kinase
VTDAKPGQLFNVSGSTDVLALCTDKPKPDEQLLTRGLGVDGKWMSVATIAAAGSAIAWMKDQFFTDHDWPAYQKLIRKLSLDTQTNGVEFEPYLAGSRTSIEQSTAAFKHLTLATNREQMLCAVLESLARQSGQRLRLLSESSAKMSRTVSCSGARHEGIERILYRDWGKGWRFKHEENASLRGLWALVDH